MTQQLIDAGRNPTVPVSVTNVGGELLQNIVLTDGTSTTPIGTTAAPLKGNVQGTQSDASVGISNPIPIAGKDVFSGQTRVPVVFNNLGIDFLLVTPVDPNLAFPNFRAGTGEAFSLVASPDDTKGSSRYLNIDSTTRSAFIQGSIAHDAVDSTNPLKIGGYASASAPTAVSADGKRVNAWFDRNGRQAVFASTLPQPDTSSATIPARGRIAAASLTSSYTSIS